MNPETIIEIEIQVAKQLKAEKLRLAKMISEKFLFNGQVTSSPDIISILRQWAIS